MDENTFSLILVPKSMQKRAANACLRCQSRKVRCDLVQHGEPCTNCRLDGLQCTVRRSIRGSRDIPTETRNMVSYSDTVSSENQNHGLYANYQIVHQLSTSSANNANSAKSTAPSVSKRPADQQSSTIPTTQRIRTGNFQLQQGFKGPPSTMSAGKIEHLELEGAFTIPHQDLRHHLLQSYFDFVQPYNPVLDIQDFLAMEQQSEEDEVSYLLFQAVMLGGSLFVEMQHLKNGGYVTRKEARQDFYKKARILYESDYEQRTFCIAQALLLMSLWYETSDNHKDCWYWSGLAVGLTQTLHLNTYHKDTDTEKVNHGKMRRLWWSAFVRDRLIALGMKLPTRLRLEDYDMPMLELDDFNDDQPSSSNISGGHKILWTAEKQRQLSIMFIEKVRLCVCIDRFITVPRTEWANLGSALEKLQTYETELRNWHSNLPQESAFDRADTSAAEHNLLVHKAVLHLVYLCTCAFLQRTYLYLSIPNLHPLTDKVLDLQRQSREKIRLTACKVAEIAQLLRRLDLIRYLPHSGIISFIHVSLIYLLDLSSVSIVDGIFQSMRTMDVFRESYFDTNYGSRLVKSVFERETLQSAKISPETETARGQSIPPSSLPNYPEPESGAAFFNLQSHEYIMEELTAFADYANPTTEQWMYENLPGSSQSQMSAGNAEFPDPDAGAQNQFDQEILDLLPSSEQHKRYGSLAEKEGNGTGTGTGLMAGPLAAEAEFVDAGPMNLEWDYTMNFE